jgi:hypothetical protein
VPSPAPALRLGTHAALALVIAVVLGVAAFVTSSGNGLGGTTWTEIALVALALGLLGALLVARVPPTAPAGVALAAFAALALLTALSVAWSVAPDQSWLEAARTTGYLAAFAAALFLARLRPRAWPALLGAIILLATGLSAWAVLVKVFSWPIEGQPALGRLLAPFAYWNATGLMAALGLAPLLWLASRRERERARELTRGWAVRAAAVPGITLLITVVMLSYSRSALAAAVVAVGGFFLLAETRLRATLMLALGGGGAAAVCGWALSENSLTADHVSAGARHASGHMLGLILLAVLIVVGSLAGAAARWSDRTVLAPEIRRRVGTVLIVCVALVPVAGVVALAESSRGLTGEVTHVWTTLTSTKASVGDSPNRLVDIANSRPRYWRQGIVVGEHHLLGGTGAGSFAVARLRYSTAILTLSGGDHVHSYVLQTFADLGLLGLLVSLLLLITWGRAAWLTLRDRAPALKDERDGVVALLAVVLAFGVSSAVDWTWFYPGVALPALLSAGWLAGRGPLAATNRGGDAKPAPLGNRPGTIFALTGLLVAGLALAWVIWQPLRAADADNAAISALAQGNAAAALANARSAAAQDPLSLLPRQELAVIFSDLREPGPARAELVEATTVQPGNPAAWSALGSYALGAHEPRLALRALRREQALDTIAGAALAAQIAQAESELARQKG